MQTSHKIRHFVRHYAEMVGAMFLGMGVLFVPAVALLAAAGVSRAELEGDLPALLLFLMGITMTAPMVAWMRLRGMAARPTAEMAAAMVVLALLILVAGWLGIVAMETLPWLAHGLMMPAMLVPMLLRLELYTGHALGAHS